MWVLFVFIVFSFVSLFFFRKKLRWDHRIKVAMFFSFIPLIAVIGRVVLTWYDGSFSYRTELPLYVCRIVAFFIPFMIWYQHKKMFGVLYFWVLAGTLNAVITADLHNGLPHYDALCYWVSHLGLIYIILYSVFVLRMKPVLRDIWNAFIIANIYMGFVHITNIILQSNYSYMY